jgi:hypothetical protein
MFKLILFLIFCSSLLAQSWSAIPNTAITEAICPANGASGSQCAANFDACSVNGTPYPYQATCNQVIRAYSGGVARTKAGSEQIIIHGGGHQAYVGNEVYAINLFGTPSASRLTNPSQWLYSYNTLECVDQMNDGQPNSVHTNQGMAYVPRLDRVYRFFGSNACATGRTTGGIWYLDFATNPPVWTKVTPNPAGFTHSYSNMSNAPAGVANASYDEVTDKIYYTHSYRFYSLRLSDNLITQLSTNPTAVEAPFHGQSVIDTKRKNWWVFGEGLAFRISIAAGSTYTWTAPVLDTSCTSLIASNSPGLFYDEVNDIFRGWVHNSGSTFWTMNPASLTCISYTVPGTVPPNGSEIHGLYGRGAYFPTLNKYVVVNDFGQTAYELPMSINGLGATTSTCLDKDGDGYGIGISCIARDADDDDVTVRTGAEAINKWGTLKNFLKYKGKNPANFWYLAASGGSDSNTCYDITGATNISTPCATWAHILSAGFTAGDMVILRSGTYNFAINLPSGLTGYPSIIQGYPGDTITLSAAEAINVGDRSWVTIDNVKFHGSGSTCPQFGGGYDVLVTNVLWSHIEAVGCVNGFRAGNGLSNYVIEESVFHDNTNHGVYLGSRHLYGTGVVVRRVLSYNNGITGMQYNGRTSGMVWEQNFTHSNDTAGYSWEMGISNSFFRNNIAINNGAGGSSGGLVLSNYPSQYVGTSGCGSAGNETCTCSPQNLGTICPYSQTGNVIENSTFYTAQNNRTGGSNTPSSAILVSNSSDCASDAMCAATTLGGNTYRNLLINTYGTAADAPMKFDIYGTGSLPTSSFINIIYNQSSGQTKGWDYRYNANGNTWLQYDCSTIGAIMTTGTISGCSNADPLFVAANSSWYNAIGSFNLRPQPGSPAVGAASVTGLDLDVTGYPRSSTAPTIGAYEYRNIPIPSVSPSSLLPGTVGVAYSQVLAASNFSTTVTWALASGTMPTGLSGCNSVTGTSCTISGTPTTTTGSPFSFVIRATDGVSSIDTAYSVAIISSAGTSGGSIQGGKKTRGGRTIH